MTELSSYKPIKAGVSLGQILHINIHQMKSEEARSRSPGRSLQSLGALQRNSAGARDELEEAGPHLLVVPGHDLPEPDHLGALGRAVLQTGVSLPVGQIYGAQASDNLTEDIMLDLGHFGRRGGGENAYQLEFSLVERFQGILWYQFMESFLKGEELLLYSLHEPG